MNQESKNVETKIEDRTLQVNEIFYSLQGEGHRAGTANVFIRLQGCKAKNACLAHGIECDTEFESGQTMTLAEILNKAVDLVGRYQTETGSNSHPGIIWTGGEPATQLDAEIISWFRLRLHNMTIQALETSGIFPIPENLDFVSVSPKCAEHVLRRNLGGVKISELRYVRHSGQAIPAPILKADHYFLSPHSDGNQINAENVRHCIDLVLKNPGWRLSTQQHKTWGVI